MSEATTLRLEERWDWIDGRRSEIVSALNELAREMPFDDRKTLRQLARWFGSNRGYEAAIRRPDILAICTQMMQCGEGRLDRATVLRAVRVGFGSIGQTLSNKGRLTRLFLYPAFLFAVMAGLAVVFSVCIVPFFQSLFVEFGIELPRFTIVFLKLALLIRYVWVYVVVGIAALGLGSCVLGAWTHQHRIAGMSWLDERFKTARNAAAGWAWHMAILLDSGVGIPEAIQIAGESQNRNWLKRAGQNWNERQATGANREDFASQKRSFGGRYRLLETTLTVADPLAQVRLFKEIANYYWTRNRLIVEWWARWAVSILFWLFVAIVVLLIYSLFVPTLKIVTGISGFPI